MSSIELRISPHPAHVRTVRLVAAALARTAGVAEERLDEIKLTVGEACVRAVRLHQWAAPTQFVRVELDDSEGLAVVVTDAGGEQEVVAVDLAKVPETARAGGDLDGLSLGLVQGLVEDVQIQPGVDGVGTRVRMRWPRG